jgi:hypothetical protein
MSPFVEINFGSLSEGKRNWRWRSRGKKRDENKKREKAFIKP